MNQNSKLSVLIPDGDSHFALWIINCLSKKKDIIIHVASQKKWVETRFSKHIESFNYIQHAADNNELLHSIKQIIHRNNIDILLPSGFPLIRMFSDNKSDLTSAGVNVLVSDSESLDTANCKWKLAQFLKENNFPFPVTYHCEELGSHYNFPLIVKPLSAWNGSGFMILKDDNDIQDYINTNPRDSILQEFIKGEDYCVNILAFEGDVLAYTIQKGILPNSNRFKPNLGSKFLDNKDLISIVRGIIEKLFWTGVVNFDVRYNSESDEFLIIEMNPRFWGSVEASESVGVNFPYLMCQLSAKIDFELPQYKKVNYVSNRGLISILKNFFLLKPSHMISVQKTSLLFALKDPKPKIFKYIKKIFNRLERLFQVLISWSLNEKGTKGIRGKVFFSKYFF